MRSRACAPRAPYVDLLGVDVRSLGVDSSESRRYGDCVDAVARVHLKARGRMDVYVVFQGLFLAQSPCAFTANVWAGFLSLYTRVDLLQI